MKPDKKNPKTNAQIIDEQMEATTDPSSVVSATDYTGLLQAGMQDATMPNGAVNMPPVILPESEDYIFDERR